MSDISFSAESYQKAIDKIHSLEKDVAGWRTTATSEQKAERARLSARVELLAKERDAHQALVNASNRRRLRLESSKWFGRRELVDTKYLYRLIPWISNCRERAAISARISATSILLLSSIAPYTFRCCLRSQVHPHCT